MTVNGYPPAQDMKPGPWHADGLVLVVLLVFRKHTGSEGRRLGGGQG